MPVPQIPTSISNMVDLVTYLNEFYAGVSAVDAGPFTVIFSQKVPAGSPSVPYTDTELVYDPDYEYVVGGKYIAAPSADNTNPTISTFDISGGFGQSAGYKPDGSTLLSITGSACGFIRAKQDPSVLGTNVSEWLAWGGGAERVGIKTDSTGKFWWKCTNYTQDGHAVIARRKRV